MSRWSIAIITQVIIAVVLGSLIPAAFSVVVNFMTSPLSGSKAEEVRNKIKANFWKWVVKDIFLILLVFGLADGAIASAPYLWGGYLRLLAWLGVQVTHTFIAAGVVAIGYGAYRFKEANKKFYGAVEVFFSAVSVIVALMTTKPDNRVGLVITVIGAMYVSSRGFGNYFKKAD